MNRPGLELADFVERRLAHAGDEVGTAESPDAVRRHRGTGGGVGRVGMVAALAEAGFNDHDSPEADKFFHCGGIERGSCFDGIGFFGRKYLHAG